MPHWAASVQVADQAFQTQRIEHAFLEPESTVVAPVVLADGSDGLHVWSGGQGMDDRDQIASVLGIDAGRVTVQPLCNGRRVRRQGGHVQPGPDRAGVGGDRAGL